MFYVEEKIYDNQGSKIRILDEEQAHKLGYGAKCGDYDYFRCGYQEYDLYVDRFDTLAEAKILFKDLILSQTCK